MCMETVTYEETYSLLAEEYENTPISKDDFSVRTYTRLQSNGINTVAKLLKSTSEDLLKIRGIGATCLAEIDKFFSILANDKKHTETVIGQISEDKTDLVITVPFKKTKAIIDNAESIAFGDFSFADDPKFESIDLEMIEYYKDSYDVLGEELAFECVASPDKVMQIIDMFNDYRISSKRNIHAFYISTLIPEYRKTNKAIPYINAFTTDDAERKQLLSFCGSKDSTIQDMIIEDLGTSNQEYILFEKFLAWCQFDLQSEIQELMKKLLSDDRCEQIINLRAEKQTLNFIGEKLGITRERVRQIEAKTIRTFINLHRNIRIISKICAERNGDSVLTPSEIELYCGEYTVPLLFLFKNYPGINYKYDETTDVFVVGDKSLNGRVQEYIDSLPDIVHVSKFNDIVNHAKENEELSDEMVEKAFMAAFSLTGKVYHRYRLSRTAIYLEVLKTYFPDGIHIYDSKEIARFREIVMADYGDIGVSEGDRALGARIASVCVLRGRGIYAHKKEQYISEELADKLYNYIFDSDQTIFMTNTIFNIFEDELLKFGIDNKYYLQGVLRELYGDKLFFRRDYVSKDPEITSIYSSIVQFVCKSRYPVSKEKIFEAFPGVPEIVVALAMSEHDILNYFGEYLHCSKLDLSENEIVYLDNLVENIVADGNPHHSKDIYEVINREKPELLTRNFAMFQFSAFSILEYLFTDKYQFSRPFIAQNGVEIGRASERLREFVYNNDELYITDLQAAAKDYSYQIYSLIEFLNECNDKFLIADSTRIVSIDSLLLDEEKARVIEEILLEEVTDTIPINQLTIWNKLPKVNAPWNEWLLYSVINKWGSKLEVSTSSNQFKLSVPLIAPRGKLDRTAYQDMTSDSNLTIYVADDLSDMDSLLEDMISDDLFVDL